MQAFQCVVNRVIERAKAWVRGWWWSSLATIYHLLALCQAVGLGATVR